MPNRTTPILAALANRFRGHRAPVAPAEPLVIGASVEDVSPPAPPDPEPIHAEPVDAPAEPKEEHLL